MKHLFRNLSTSVAWPLLLCWLNAMCYEENCRRSTLIYLQNWTYCYTFGHLWLVSVKYINKLSECPVRLLTDSNVDVNGFQDTFLPHVESGTIILIGATTENPSFHINSALLSRCKVVVLEKLSVDNLRVIVDRAVNQLGITKHVGTSEETKTMQVYSFI